MMKFWPDHFGFVAIACLLAVLSTTQANQAGAEQEALDCSIGGNRGLAICGDVDTGGGVINLGGLTDKQVQDLIEAQERNSETVAELALSLGVTRNAVQTFFGILEEAHVEPHLLTQKLVEIAQQHLALRDRVAVLVTDDPAIQGLIDQAQAAIGQGDYDQADTLLTQAENADLAAARQAEELANQALEAVSQRYLQAAATRARRGDLSLTRLRYLEAAGHFKEAADVAPASESLQRAVYLAQQGYALDRGSRTGVVKGKLF